MNKYVASCPTMTKLFPELTVAGMHQPTATSTDGRTGAGSASTLLAPTRCPGPTRGGAGSPDPAWPGTPPRGASGPGWHRGKDGVVGVRGGDSFAARRSTTVGPARHSPAAIPRRPSDGAIRARGCDFARRPHKLSGDARRPSSCGATNRTAKGRRTKMPELRGQAMPAVKCSVDGCSRRLQPILKVEPQRPGHLAPPGVRPVPQARLRGALVGSRGPDHLRPMPQGGRGTREPAPAARPGNRLASRPGMRRLASGQQGPSPARADAEAATGESPSAPWRQSRQGGQIVPVSCRSRLPSLPSSPSRPIRPGRFALVDTRASRARRGLTGHPGCEGAETTMGRVPCFLPGLGCPRSLLAFPAPVLDGLRSSTTPGQ